MSENIQTDTDVSASKDAFDAYFQTEIEQLVDEDNKIKRRYRSRFWAFFWSVTFLVCINALIAIFNTLMSGHPFNWQLLILISICAYSVIVFPVLSYYRHKREDIFDVFLRQYGSWKHGTNKEVRLVHSPVIPEHDSVTSSHDIESLYNGIQVEMRDTSYTKKIGPEKWNWHRTVSSGVILMLKFPQDFAADILLFDRNGFMRKNKFRGQPSRIGIIDVPAANYFHVFCADDTYLKKVLRSSFFESLLDLKEAMKAKNAYVEISQNYMRVYFEGSSLYTDSYKFWSNALDKNKFRQLDDIFRCTFAFIDVNIYLISDL